MLQNTPDLSTLEWLVSDKNNISAIRHSIILLEEKQSIVMNNNIEFS
jgi:hypothetical protein